MTSIKAIPVTLLKIVKHFFNLVISPVTRTYICNIMVTHDFNVDFLLIKRLRASVPQLYDECMHKIKKDKKEKK